MSGVLMEPADLRARGFAALVRELGWVNAVRFIQQYEPSAHNYTAQRDSLLPPWNAAELARQAKAISG